LITPPITDGALEGVTRQIILDLAKDAGLMPIEKSMTAYDVYNADACFLTGTGAELIPVCSIDGRMLKACPSKPFEQLSQLFQQTIEKECA